LITRVIRYIVVGLTATFVYSALVWLLAACAGLETLVATSIAFVSVVLMNYQLHYRWTFTSRNPHGRTFSKFVVTSVIGFFLNAETIYLGVVAHHFNFVVVQFVAIVIVVASNFLLSALWVFRASGKTPSNVPILVPNSDT
jgi:putative flippase GtrA